MRSFFAEVHAIFFRRSSCDLFSQKFSKDLRQHSFDRCGLTIEVIGSLSQKSVDCLSLSQIQFSFQHGMALEFLEPTELANLHVEACPHLLDITESCRSGGNLLFKVFRHPFNCHKDSIHGNAPVRFHSATNLYDSIQKLFFMGFH